MRRFGRRHHGRGGAGRTLASAGLAVAGLMAIGVGAAIKTGFVTVGEPSAVAAADTAPALRASGGDVVPAGPADTTAVHPSPVELAELASELTVPVAGVTPDQLLDTFDELRGARRHNALDIPAPRGTPVLAAATGRVLRLFTSDAGGLMVYTTDPSSRFVLMYAHLDAYAEALQEGQTVLRGQTIGTVGTTGNAPPNVPHLHFAIARTSDVSKWWLGTPVDPRPLLHRQAPDPAPP